MKINLSFSEKIEAALEVVQRGCSVRKFAAITLIQEVKEFEYMVTKDVGVPRCRLEGCSVMINAAPGKFAKSYHGVPQSTYCVVKFTRNGAYLADVIRSYCNNIKYDFNPTINYEEALTESAKKGFQNARFISSYKED